MATDALTTTDGYDYERLPDHKRATMRQYARYIRRQEQKTVENIVQIGDTLIAAEIECDHGEWLIWIAAEFPRWSDQTARRYMRIAEAHKQNQHIVEFGITALHELLAPSVEPAAIEEAIEATEAGATITVAAAKEIAAKHKKPKAAKVKPEIIPVVEETDDEAGDEPESEPFVEELPRGETVFTRLRKVFDEMTPLQRVTATGMWRNWCDPE